MQDTVEVVDPVAQLALEPLRQAVPILGSQVATWARLVTEPEPVTLTVEQVTGVPARTFRQRTGNHMSDLRPPCG